MVQEARVVVLPILVLLLATLTAALSSSRQQQQQQQQRPVVSCFVGCAMPAGSAAARSDPASSAASSRVYPASAQGQNQQQQRQHQQHGGGTTAVNQTPPLARRMLLRRALARPKLRTGGRSAAAADAPAKGSAPDVDNLFRLEVAQRMKEMKLMTQPGVGPLAPVTKAAAAAAAAARLTETLLPSNKLEGDAAALEHQISLLSARITSIANYLKTTPTDAVSRKGLVVLVKRRRRLLQTLRHRDIDRWLATTDTLGLRQRPDVPPATTAGWGEARRERRRDRGRRRRRDEEAGRRQR
eukprot:g1631.t1